MRLFVPEEHRKECVRKTKKVRFLVPEGCVLFICHKHNKTRVLQLLETVSKIEPFIDHPILIIPVEELEEPSIDWIKRMVEMSHALIISGGALRANSQILKDTTDYARRCFKAIYSEIYIKQLVRGWHNEHIVD